MQLTILRLSLTVQDDRLIRGKERVPNKDVATLAIDIAGASVLNASGTVSGCPSV